MGHSIAIIVIILLVMDIILPHPPVDPMFQPWWRMLPGSELFLWLFFFYVNRKK